MYRMNLWFNKKVHVRLMSFSYRGEGWIHSCTRIVTLSLWNCRRFNMISGWNTNKKCSYLNILVMLSQSTEHFSKPGWRTRSSGCSERLMNHFNNIIKFHTVRLKSSDANILLSTSLSTQPFPVEEQRRYVTTVGFTHSSSIISAIVCDCVVFV